MLQHLRQNARPVAQHEMGHYVAARVLGFRTGEVSVTVQWPDGHHGAATVTLPQSLSTLDDVRYYLRNRVQILYAGAAAETLPCNCTEKKVDSEKAIKIINNPGNGAETDHAKARELIHLLRDMEHSDCDVGDEVLVQCQLDNLSQELWNQAVALVELHADTIVGLAGNLSSRVQAPNEKIEITAQELENIPSVKALTAVQ